MIVILYIVSIVILLSLFVFMTIWAFSIFASKIPFVRVPSRLFSQIHKELNVDKNSVVYVLPASDSRFMLYLKNKVPGVSLFGVEKNFFSNLLIFLYGGRNKIKIIKKEFNDVDFTPATHLCLYIYPNLMDDLLETFDKQLKKGTRIISLNFQFTQKRPIKEIELKESKFQQIKKIYVYEF